MQRGPATLAPAQLGQESVPTTNHTPKKRTCFCRLKLAALKRHRTADSGDPFIHTPDHLSWLTRGGRKVALEKHAAFR
jgi:hypothetical protein